MSTENENEQPPDLVVRNVVDPHSWTRALEAARLINLQNPVSKVIIEIDFNGDIPVNVTTIYPVRTYGERNKWPQAFRQFPLGIT